MTARFSSPRVGLAAVDGPSWHEVRLSDGTVGYSSAEFLAPPASWQVGFDEMACGAGSTASDPGSGSVGTVVNGWAHVEGADCSRFILALGVGTAFDGALTPADHVPVGAEARVDPSGVSVALPGLVDVEAIATNTWLGDTLGVIAQPPGDISDLRLEARLIGIGDGDVSLSALSNPARLVIDVENPARDRGSDRGRWCAHDLDGADCTGCRARCGCRGWRLRPLVRGGRESRASGWRRRHSSAR